MCCTEELTVSGVERFPGELDTLRADNVRLRRLLRLSEEQARAAASDQATLTGASASPVTMGSSSVDKVRFFFELFRCRTDIYALRWENRRDGRSGWMPAIKGYWRKGMNRADAPYLPLTPEVIDAHLRGEAHIGLYPLSDDDTCWWVAADFDKEAAMLDALAYMKAARSYGIPAALEVSQSGRGAHVWIFFAHAISASVARSIATSLLSEAFRLRGSMHLSSYDRLFPSQDVHTGRGVGNLIAAPMNGKRRQHGTTVFLDPATLEPYEDQWAYLSSIARLSTKDVTALARQLPDPQIGHNVRRLQLPTSSRIIPRPAAIVRAEFASRLTLTANDLGPAMISAVKHAASIRNPEFDARQRARRSTWDTPRFLYSYDETADGDLVLPRGLHPLLTELVESADSTLHVDDKRVLGEPRKFTCSTPLRTVQTTALHRILKRTPVSSSPPGHGKDCYRLCGNRITSHRDPGPGRSQGPGRSMARPDQPPPEIRMRSDRWRAFENHGHPRHRATADACPPRQRRGHHRHLRIRHCGRMPPRRRQRILRRPEPHSRAVLARPDRHAGAP